jgi:hypothetical protein
MVCLIAFEHHIVASRYSVLATAAENLDGLRVRETLRLNDASFYASCVAPHDAPVRTRWYQIIVPEAQHHGFLLSGFTENATPTVGRVNAWTP